MLQRSRRPAQEASSYPIFFLTLPGSVLWKKNPSSRPNRPPPPIHRKACDAVSRAPSRNRMIDPVRQEVIALAHTVVVKVGTNVLANADGTLDRGRLQALADQVQRIRQTGRKVALVS